MASSSAGKVLFATLGCKINQYETQSLRESLGLQGFIETDVAGEADWMVVNSCAVTARAVRDLRQTVRRLNRENPDARIVVTGCAAQVMAEDLAGLPGVSAVLPQVDKWLAGQGLPLAGKAEPEPVPGGDVVSDAGAAPRAFPPFGITDFSRARPVVKVQDGCSHGCTYCIVPLTRGRSVSRPYAETLAEIRVLLDHGFREFILSGINLRQYGRDLVIPEKDTWDFWDLVRALDAELAPQWADGPDRARLRISSLDPAQCGDKALDVLSGSRLVCPHLHLSLQSASPSVLRRMGRGHYKPEVLAAFLDQLAAAWPRMGMGADVLVGFPGESDAEFQETERFCEQVALTYAHVFPYSRRPGTRAASLPDQVERAVRKERAALIRGLVETKKSRFLAEEAGLERVHVLLQDRATGEGLSEHYVPCRFRCPEAGAPAWVEVRRVVAARPMGLDPDGGAVVVEAESPAQ